jgi:hypothetical protein
MEWLNKAIEPFIFPQNEVLMSMPERVDFDYATILSFLEKNNGHLRIGLDELIMFAVAQVNLKLDKDDLSFLSNYFVVDIVPDTEINFEQGTLTGGISLRKTKDQLSDEEIVSYAADIVYYRLYGIYSKSNISRCNEIMDLIGAEAQRQSTSTRYKIREIAATMASIIREDRWRIRNVALLLKCPTWIQDYLEDGNLAAMSNFTRLKCMVHKGVPIYSMEETK